MSRENLSEPEAMRNLNKVVRDLQSANPLENGSVDNGTLTIRSRSGGLVVEATGQFLAQNGAKVVFEGLLEAARVVVDGNSTLNGQVTVGSETTPANTFLNGQLLTTGDVFLEGVPESSSTSGKRMLAIGSNGLVSSVPIPTGGGGGDPGGGGDNPKGLIYPFPLSELGDPWGPRDYAPSPFHYGMDWPKPEGTPIIAAGDGTVIMAEDTGYLWGNYIRVDHGDGIWTAYAHIMYGGMYVSVGDTVTRGQVIAGVGTTGPSTGNHLHFELYQNGERINPETYIGPE